MIAEARIKDAKGTLENVLEHARQRVIDVARRHIGTPYVYRREECAEPDSFNCYLFARFVFRRCGYELPLEFPIDENADAVATTTGQRILYISDLSKYAPADLLFTRGRKQVWGTAGHLGIATDCHTVIHASYFHGTVLEESLDDLFERDPLQMIGRIIR